jgi:hypothetical protein
VDVQLGPLGRELTRERASRIVMNQVVSGFAHE